MRTRQAYGIDEEDTTEDCESRKPWLEYEKRMGVGRVWFKDTHSGYTSAVNTGRTASLMLVSRKAIVNINERAGLR